MPDESGLQSPLESLAETAMRVRRERDALLECLRELFGHIKSGRLVRDISHDHERRWALKSAPLIVTLVKAQALIDAADANDKRAATEDGNG